MRESEHQTLVSQIERGNKWQRMFLILLAEHTRAALPEATKTEWASEYEQVNLWLKMQGEGKWTENEKDFTKITRSND